MRRQMGDQGTSYFNDILSAREVQMIACLEMVRCCIFSYTRDCTFRECMEAVSATPADLIPFQEQSQSP